MTREYVIWFMAQSVARQEAAIAHLKTVEEYGKAQRTAPRSTWAKVLRLKIKNYYSTWEKKE